ncbi:MAG TPA: HNH endonuclease [Actinomycetes bacterium]|nr:HNH endonuclease [Actinomycetes bacterium]
MIISGAEEALRQRIMASLAERTAHNGGVISRAELSDFSFAPGERRRLIDTSRGIWNPRDLAATLTIVSSPNGPYDDQEVEGGLFRYDYRAGSDHGDNTKLRRAAELGLPLILLRKIAPGVYVPIFPVYVVSDDPSRKQFLIALDESLRFLRDPLHPTAAERRYAERVVRQRLHQPEFRGRVIRAYETQCAICRLRHGELLDAAHILADADGGLPVVTNGLAMCKIHHAAYDRDFLSVDRDYTIHIKPSLLEERDGPMLLHGLQEVHGHTIEVPHAKAERPDPTLLDARHRVFLASA